MALKNIRIGSMADIHRYDNSLFAEAIETTEPIAAGDPVDDDHVVTLGYLPFKSITVTSISNPTELNALTGTAGDMIMAQQVQAGLDVWTLYAYDAAGPSVDAPYVMDASGAGSERWVAIGGRYSRSELTIKAAFTVLGDITGYDRYIKSTGGAGYLKLYWNESDGSSRTLALLVNAGNRSLTIEADSLLNQDLTTDADPEFNTVKCQGNQVIAAQGAAVADATDAASAITQLNALLARCRAHGLIAT